MTTMNLTLPDDMKAFVEEQAAKRGYVDASEYVRSVLLDVQTREQARSEIRGKLLEAVESGPATPMTRSDWDDIQREVERRHKSRQGNGDARKKSPGSLSSAPRSSTSRKSPTISPTRQVCGCAPLRPQR
jgi:antitoxin ParD1/3/4